MPRKRKADSDFSPEDGGFTIVEIPFDFKLRWSSPYLTVEDKQWLQGHVDQLPRLVAHFQELLEPGFVLTTRYDSSTGRWLATLVCKDANHEAVGRALSCRGSNSFNALAAMAYFIRQAEPLSWWMATGGDSGGDFG